VPVDIRSDLYSLGVTLWETVTGKAPFRGTASEVMFHHQRTPLSFDLLKDVPQPVVVLLEALLEKDPGRRFQTPGELLKAIPTIIGAIDARRRITRQSLHKALSTASRVGTRKPPARPAPKKISKARPPVTGSDVFGREEDIAFLDNAWTNPQVNVVTIVAWAGVGKSTLVNHWLRRMAAEQYLSAQLVFGWSFYRQGSSGETSSAARPARAFKAVQQVPLQWDALPQLREGLLYGTLVHMIKEKIPELQKLSTADKFALAVELWDELSSNPDEIPVTEDQLNELDRRFEEYRQDPDKVVTWEEAKARILSGRR
jgi:putative addiction module component (TIGR02574 family)